MVNEGAWEPLDTIIAAVVATILWCVTWPAEGDPFTTRWAVAHALVYGLIAGTGLAWIVQSVKWWNYFEEADCTWWQMFSDADCVKLEGLDLAATEATMIALLLAVFVAVGVFVLLFLTRVKERAG
jgi:hypothetical protein